MMTLAHFSPKKNPLHELHLILFSPSGKNLSNGINSLHNIYLNDFFQFSSHLNGLNDFILFNFQCLLMEMGT